MYNTLEYVNGKLTHRGHEYTEPNRIGMGARSPRNICENQRNLDECDVFELSAKDPSRGNDVHVSRTLYCGENVQTTHRLDLEIHRADPLVCIGSIKCLFNRSRVRRCWGWNA